MAGTATCSDRCTPVEPCCAEYEACHDGVDDDCDGETDENGCDIGSPCSDDAACRSSGLVCNENWGGCVVGDCTGERNFTPCELITSPDRSYDICVDDSCRSPGCGDASCNAPGPNGTLEDTGQRICTNLIGFPPMSCPGTPGTAECETAEFCGQDAQYGWDATHDPGERFERTEPVEGEPIVPDAVTADRRRLSTSCGAAIRSTSRRTRSPRTLTWAGSSNWRLHDELELQSVVDRGHGSAPTIYADAFPEGPSDAWSSSSDARRSSDAWGVYFSSTGYAGSLDKSFATFVLCVHRAASYGGVTLPRFERTEAVAGYPVVADAATGLMWQGCAAGETGVACTGSPASMTWQEALDYCQDSMWAGFSDWYLPNVVELLSIVDDRVSAPSLDSDAFPGAVVPGGQVWSSTSCADHWDLAWHVEFASGGVGGSDKRSSAGDGVRCVRQAF